MEKARVETIDIFRLYLGTNVFLDFKNIFIVPSFRHNLIYIFYLNKSRYYFSFGNENFSIFKIQFRFVLVP